MATATVDNPAITATVETSKAVDDTLLATVGIVLSYATLEVVNHVILTGYVSPWLVSVGLSMTTATTISYAILFVAIVGMGYLFTRFFKRKQKNE